MNILYNTWGPLSTLNKDQISQLSKMSTRILDRYHMDFYENMADIFIWYDRMRTAWNPNKMSNFVIYFGYRLRAYIRILIQHNQLVKIPQSEGKLVNCKYLSLSHSCKESLITYDIDDCNEDDELLEYDELELLGYVGVSYDTDSYVDVEIPPRGV